MSTIIKNDNCKSQQRVDKINKKLWLCSTMQAIYRENMHFEEEHNEKKSAAPFV